MNGCFKSRAIRCRENLYGAFECTYVAHRFLSRLWPYRESARHRTTVYEPSLVPQSSEARVGKLNKLNSQLQALWRPNGSKHLQNILWARMAYCRITHRFFSIFTCMGPVNARELHVAKAFG